MAEGLGGRGTREAAGSHELCTFASMSGEFNYSRWLTRTLGKTGRKDAAESERRSGRKKYRLLMPE